jgi:hypothetical protein
LGGGWLRSANPAEKLGFNRLKNEGFQALLSGSILACGMGEKGGINGVKKGDFGGQIPHPCGDVSHLCGYYLCIYMKKLDLLMNLHYDLAVFQALKFVNPNPERVT